MQASLVAESWQQAYQFTGGRPCPATPFNSGRSGHGTVVIRRVRPIARDDIARPGGRRFPLVRATTTPENGPSPPWACRLGPPRTVDPDSDSGGDRPGDARGQTGRRDALELSIHDQGPWGETGHGALKLVGSGAQAPSARDFQALQRPARRGGPGRCGRPVSQPIRRSGRALHE